MYSMVLLAALTATTDAPDWHRGGGCCGCYGYSNCCGCWGGCYGACWGGCYGYSCCGCYGGWSCGGGGWGGCYGGCSGCWGGYYSGGCCGCWGGGDSYYGGGYMAPPPGSGSDGSGTPKGSPEGSTGKVGSGEVRALGNPTAARIVLDVPEDAKVYVDNRLMKSNSTHRVYASPALDFGQAYYYDVRVEVERDGKVVSNSKRMVIRAGEEFAESFVDLGKKSTAVAKGDK